LAEHKGVRGRGGDVQNEKGKVCGTLRLNGRVLANSKRISRPGVKNPHLTGLDAFSNHQFFFLEAMLAVQGTQKLKVSTCSPMHRRTISSIFPKISALEVRPKLRPSPEYEEYILRSF
jgi:hypothetical protein